MNAKLAIAAALTALTLAGAGLAYGQSQPAEECCCETCAEDCECCDHEEQSGAH